MELQKVIEERLSIFVNMYDVLRVVDPIQKSLVDGCESCFACMGKDKPCENCTSMRALQKNDTTMKIEAVNGGYIVITSVPVVYEDQLIIAEMIKNYSAADLEEMVIVGENRTLEEEISKLSRELIIDPMTEVYNKRFIYERLPAEIFKAQKAGGDLYLIMADIDFFKKFNDNYGHIVGDDILKFFAGELNSNFGHGKNWVARFGGEEFVVMLQGRDINIEGKMSSFINILHNAKCLCSDGEEHEITASFGVAKYEGEDMQALIEKADKNLYTAKQNGRDGFFFG